MISCRRFILSLLFFSVFVSAQTSTGPTVRFATNMGNIDVTMLPGSAPRTVEQFMGFVNGGAYNNTIFHRAVRGFIIQGGGFRFANGTFQEILRDAPTIPNEFRVSNTRGTIAMAKLGGDPNSATSQWFFNLADNSQNLNNQNGGFTVFGRVANNASLAVMDRIAALPVYESPVSDTLPLQNWRGGAVTLDNFVVLNSITVLGPVPAISENGVISVSNFGALPFAAPGSYIEIYGSNFGDATRTWAFSDFTEGRAPTALEGVSVTINGQPAYVYYVSPTQVNVQVPASVPAGGSVPVVVRFNGQASATAQLPIRPVAAGLLAPASFKAEDRQYVAAVHHGTGAFVGNGRFADIPADPAKPGETLVFYGIGFGPVSPSNTQVAGYVAQGQTSVTNSVEFRFGDTPAQIGYAGLVPELVGVYQFNVTVPQGVAAGDVPLRVLVGSEPITQNLFIPVATGN
jgi:uncharacterized protein (TIGR03437 family)